VMVVRIGASMYFANVAFIRDYLHKIVDETRGLYAAALTDADGTSTAEESEPVEYIVIEMTPVISVDSTALHMLEDLHSDLLQRNVRLCLSTVGNRVMSTMRRAGLTDKIGSEWIHASVDEAVRHCAEHRRERVATFEEATPVNSHSDKDEAEDAPGTSAAASHV